MANYRYKTTEIEAMKNSILTHIANETETQTAWRLRLAIEGQLMCCRPNKRRTAQLERELALYERLTKNDLPNWQTEPTQPATATETAQISTKADGAGNLPTESSRAAETTLNSRDAVIAYLDRVHGIEHNAGEVVYLIDGYVAEEHDGGKVWRLYSNEESDTCAQTIIIAPQSHQTREAADCTTDADKARQTA